MANVSATLEIRLGSPFVQVCSAWRICVNDRWYRAGDAVAVDAGMVPVRLCASIVANTRRYDLDLLFETHVPPGGHVVVAVPSRRVVPATRGRVPSTGALLQRR